MVYENLALPIVLVVFIVIAAIWEMIWKGIGLWKSGRNNHLVWFVFILVFNTFGILPLIYLGFFQKKWQRKKKGKK